MGYTAALLTVIAKPRPSGRLLQANVHAGAALQPGVPSAALAEQSRGGTTALQIQPQVTRSDPGCRQERFPSSFSPQVRH